MAIAGSLTGCVQLWRPLTGADRVDEVAFRGTDCEIGWWLAALNDGATDEAWVVARRALQTSEVSTAEAKSWRETLLSDPDVTWDDPVRLDASAHREAVRADVRDALEKAGYPDLNRVIEVYSDLKCSS